MEGRGINAMSYYSLLMTDAHARILKQIEEYKEREEVNKLETESLVSYLYQVKGFLEGGEQTLQTEPIREIIQALRRGEKFRNFAKYKEMWYRLKNIMTSGKVYTLFPGRSASRLNIMAIVKAFESIEERYSKKPKKEIVELIKELNKDMRDLLKICEERMGD